MTSCNNNNGVGIMNGQTEVIRTSLCHKEDPIIENTDSESLRSLFSRCYKIYNVYYHEDATESQLERDAANKDNSKCSNNGTEIESVAVKPLKELRDSFLKIAFCIEKLSLFSKNEELDDVNTADLIFLLTPFILAELCSNGREIEGRLELLESAVIYWHRFMEYMKSYGVCSKNDLKRFNRTSSDINTADRSMLRAEKIEAYKQQKELTSSIQALFDKKRRICKDPYFWGESEVDEEVERQLIVALLKRSIGETIDHHALTKTEIEFLKHRQKLSELGEERGGRSKQEPVIGTVPKPYILTINDPTEIKKLYRDKVFTPFHTLPTISLAEVAEWEMAVEVDELGAKGRAKEQQIKNRKLSNLEGQTGLIDTFDNKKTDGGYHVNSDEDGDSDSSEERNRKEKKARDWDDWKDENPKGMGNKNRNVG